MTRVAMLACLIFLGGCDRWAAKAANPSQHLAMTADGAADAAWEIRSVFKATKGPPFLCMSFGEDGGGWRYDVMTVPDTLTTKGDTVKAPLDWAPSLCGWEFSELDLTVSGGKYEMGQLMIQSAAPSPDNVVRRAILPDTLDYGCRLDSSCACRRCDERKGHTGLSFSLPGIGSSSLHIHLQNL